MNRPLIDDGTVIALIYRADQRPVGNARFGPTADRTRVQIWACAKSGAIWLRHTTGTADLIDDDTEFTSLTDLGRILAQAATRNL